MAESLSIDTGSADDVDTTACLVEAIIVIGIGLVVTYCYASYYQRSSSHEASSVPPLVIDDDDGGGGAIEASVPSVDIVSGSTELPASAVIAGSTDAHRTEQYPGDIPISDVNVDFGGDGSKCVRVSSVIVARTDAFVEDIATIIGAFCARRRRHDTDDDHHRMCVIFVDAVDALCDSTKWSTLCEMMRAARRQSEPILLVVFNADAAVRHTVNGRFVNCIAVPATRTMLDDSTASSSSSVKDVVGVARLRDVYALSTRR
jgi:hypothetical protein